MACADCFAVTGRVSPLQRRVRELERLLSAKNMVTADSVNPGPDSRSASPSTRSGLLAAAVELVPARSRHGRGHRSRSEFSVPFQPYCGIYLQLRVICQL